MRNETLVQTQVQFVQCNAHFVCAEYAYEFCKLLVHNYYTGSSQCRVRYKRKRRANVFTPIHQWVNTDPDLSHAHIYVIQTDRLKFMPQMKWPDNGENSMANETDWSTFYNAKHILACKYLHVGNEIVVCGSRAYTWKMGDEERGLYKTVNGWYEKKCNGLKQGRKNALNVQGTRGNSIIIFDFYRFVVRLTLIHDIQTGLEASQMKKVLMPWTKHSAYHTKVAHRHHSQISYHNRAKYILK